MSVNSSRDSPITKINQNALVLHIPLFSTNVAPLGWRIIAVFYIVKRL
jgi:hypothetical protein